MARALADKLFGYRVPIPDRVWMDALVIFTTDRRGIGKNEISTKQMRRKRSLALMNMQPDMVTLVCLRAVRKHLLAEYNVRFDGYANKFKEEYEVEKTSRLLGFMETVLAIFARRKPEMDMVLKMCDSKAMKAAHAIRDLGTFHVDSYEEGREEAYKLVILALPQRKRFNLLEGAELLQEPSAA